MLGENSDRPDLEELDNKMNAALDAIDNLDSNDSDNADQIDNANEVVDQFTKIDNLNDKDQVKNFLNQDNVQKINKNNDA